MAIKTKFKIVDPITLDTEPIFFEDGEECPKYEIDTTSDPIAKQFTAYSLIIKDIRLLIEWANQIQNIPERKESGKIEWDDTLICFPPLAALIVIYGRLFTTNSSRGTSLNKRDHVDPRYHKIHDELINLRNNYIAHSSDKGFEKAKAYVVLNPKNKDQFVIQDFWSGIHGTGGMSLFPKEVIEHLENLLKTANKKFETLSSKLTEMYQKKTITLKK